LKYSKGLLTLEHSKRINQLSVVHDSNREQLPAPIIRGEESNKNIKRFETFSTSIISIEMTK